MTRNRKTNQGEIKQYAARNWTSQNKGACHVTSWHQCCILLAELAFKYSKNRLKYPKVFWTKLLTFRIHYWDVVTRNNKNPNEGLIFIINFFIFFRKTHSHRSYKDSNHKDNPHDLQMSLISVWLPLPFCVKILPWHVYNNNDIIHTIKTMCVCKTMLETDTNNCMFYLGI